jgi:hypothetical protein
MGCGVFKRSGCHKRGVPSTILLLPAEKRKTMRKRMESGIITTVGSLTEDASVANAKDDRKDVVFVPSLE